jgi:hypothetical protein
MKTAFGARRCEFRLILAEFLLRWHENPSAAVRIFAPWRFRGLHGNVAETVSVLINRGAGG